ncbi:MAG: tyrosine-type recombinase/integrase [gamma proteobacterium symbiont of Lucinoma myriamae]|nr:tyrosine-type recombinase/integrase [gamma proteobacterium symbiont of Lucinoma myriamae]MCU7819282.1 tyrosine-type recombinase/integrase [gamma proteobacterium symbiont of Lucinoma myriamae]MCU7831608.1 tyrosine-type recombinase/integrase [gamma proteobacterium symbiont of Lucinoma myriamae]
MQRVKQKLISRLVVIPSDTLSPKVPTLGATSILESGINIRVMQELMGHADVKTTEIYTHVMDKDISKISSPLEEIKIYSINVI